MAIKALEKQIPKKVKELDYEPLIREGWRNECPTCGSAVGVNRNAYYYTEHDKYCPTCGQKLYWGT